MWTHLDIPERRDCLFHNFKHLHIIKHDLNFEDSKLFGGSIENYEAKNGEN